MANYGYNFSGMADGAVPGTLDVLDGSASISGGDLVGTGGALVEHNVADYANVFVAIRPTGLVSVIEVLVRSANDGDDTYLFDYLPSGTLVISKRAGGDDTTLETINSVTQDAGDMFAALAHTVGATVHLRWFRKPSGGSWAALGTGVTDSSSPHTAAGPVQVYLNDAGDTIDKLEIYDALETGNTFPTSGTNVDRAGSTAWTNPGNVVSDNGSDATCNATGSDYLVAAAHGFAVPSNATILGVIARIEASEHSTGTEDLSVQLQNDSATLVGSAKTATISGTTKVVYTLGSPSDLWGATLTPTIVNDADFGTRSWFTTSHDVRIDYETLNVVYITALDVTLVVADASLALAVDNAALTQKGVLAVNDSAIALGAEAAALTQKNVLAAADAAVALAVDAPALVQHYLLIAADVGVALAAESPALTQKSVLAAADATVALGADTPALTQKNVLAANGAGVALAVDSAALTQKNLIAVGDASVALTVDGVTLSLAGALGVADALIALAAEDVALTQKHILTVGDATVALVVDAPALTHAHLLAVADALIAFASDSAGLTQKNILAATDSAVALNVDNSVLALLYSIVVADSLVALTAESVVLVFQGAAEEWAVISPLSVLSPRVSARVLSPRVTARLLTPQSTLSRPDVNDD